MTHRQPAWNTNSARDHSDRLKMGRKTLHRNLVVVIGCLIALGGCSRQPRTDQELTSEAQRAVNRKLGIQAQYTLMESAVVQQIACGHAAAPGANGRDFVYRDGKVILDDDPDFDDAAVQCDAAIGGGGAPAADNSAG